MNLKKLIISIAIAASSCVFFSCEQEEVNPDFSSPKGETTLNTIGNESIDVL
ncbi:MAG: hypothetical protein AAGI07_05425 [Bacteroidota bacterium]